jgi:hypothetical protein
MKTVISFIASLLTAFAHAGRGSADYAITIETLDFGGQRAVSADYSNDGSLTAITGVSSEATTPTIVKHGYIGQLFELGSFAGLIASNNYPDELGTTQLYTVRSVDDGTTMVAPPAGFVMSVLDGPITSISPTGLVTAGAVYEHTAATVAATSDLTGQLTLPLFVQNTLPDNFGSYAGDGITDSWQNQYFGLNNPLAAPGMDASGTGQNNLFKFIAGLNPLDPSSVFRLSIEPVPGQPGQMRLVFTPRLTDRSYVVRHSDTLSPVSWQPLMNITTSDDGQTRTVTDLDASGDAKFYDVQISRP